MLDPIESPTGANVTASAISPATEEENARLVRNLLALRLILSMDQMQTGKWGEHIEDIDETLAGLGHDMKSTMACAADGMRRSLMLPRLVSRNARARRRPSPRVVPPG
jgi:hypothetical protein